MFYLGTLKMICKGKNVNKLEVHLAQKIIYQLFALFRASSRRGDLGECSKTVCMEDTNSTGLVVFQIWLCSF